MYILIKKSCLITIMLFLCFFLVITIGLTTTIIIRDVQEKKVRDEMQHENKKLSQIIHDNQDVAYENKKLSQKIYHNEDINDGLKNENTILKQNIEDNVKITNIMKENLIKETNMLNEIIQVICPKDSNIESFIGTVWYINE